MGRKWGGPTHVSRCSVSRFRLGLNPAAPDRGLLAWLLKDNASGPLLLGLHRDSTAHFLHPWTGQEPLLFPEEGKKFQSKKKEHLLSGSLKGKRHTHSPEGDSGLAPEEAE